MYTEKKRINTTASANGGSDFADAYYWSSTEIDLNFAWLHNFYNGLPVKYAKYFPGFSVRAVRAF